MASILCEKKKIPCFATPLISQSISIAFCVQGEIEEVLAFTYYIKVIEVLCRVLEICNSTYQLKGIFYTHHQQHIIYLNLKHVVSRWKRRRQRRWTQLWWPWRSRRWQRQRYGLVYSFLFHVISIEKLTIHQYLYYKLLMIRNAR